MDNLKDFKNIHFIGIGGIGISAIARKMILEGKSISGSDVNDSEITKELQNFGARIFIGHDKRNINSSIELVIYTIAIPEDNPELIAARRFNIPLLTYPQVLGLISKDYYTIAISGTHGKTTTTAMTAKIFLEAGMDPTVIVGSILKDCKSNFIAGKGKYLIVEACEYKKSFLNLNPKIIAITNIDNDHLDYYRDIEDIRNAFGEFVLKLSQGGFLICDRSDDKIKLISKTAEYNIIDYTSIENKFNLKFPGEHYINDAKVALSIARIVGINDEIALHALDEFRGTWRRFDYKGMTQNGTLIYDDYAHHPTEIKATLKALRQKYPAKKISAVFQPHLFSRTKLLLDDFASSFDDADEILLAPIYAAREKKDESINSSMLADKLRKNRKNVIALENLGEIADYLRNKGDKNSVILTMGANDIYKVGEALIGK